MERLDGQVVIVTGAGRGIGRAMALGLAEAGATVVVNDRGDEEGEGSPALEVVAAIEAAAGRAAAGIGDIAEPDDVDALVAGTITRFGRLDGVINNAGIVRDRMLHSMDVADWEAVMAVHLRGHFLLTRAACRHWRARVKSTGAPARAAVVSVSSESGLYGNAGQSNYAAAKAGIAAFGMVVAREMKPYGVTSNVLAPRARTRMTEGAFGTFSRQDGPDPWDPENVVPAVEFLLSDAGQSYTGQILVAGGGVVQVVAPYSVAGEIRTGDRRPTRAEVGGLLSDAVGPNGGPPRFPELGL